ncbi:hypothetical protein HanIR_Chr15g0781411 [Helianthus annuus]|nr:hypothetical protein HanIR_Chr15g0781411 [Helianthus annuus]
MQYPMTQQSPFHRSQSDYKTQKVDKKLMLKKVHNKIYISSIDMQNVNMSCRATKNATKRVTKFISAGYKYINIRIDKSTLTKLPSVNQEHM